MGKITRLCDLNFTELFRNYEFQKDPDSNSSDEDEDVPAEEKEKILPKKKICQPWICRVFIVRKCVRDYVD